MSTRSVGYFRPGGSWLHRRNPVTKLLALLWVAVAAFVLPPIAQLVLLALLFAVAASTRLLGELLRSLRLPALLFASIFFVNAFFYPGAVERIVAIGPVGLSTEGMVYALVATARILTVFVASVLFLFTTLADDLLEALVAKGIGHRLAFVILSAVQLVPRMQVRAAAILDAQQARGLRIGGWLPSRTRAIVPLMGPLILGSLIDVRERTFALEARAFGARRERTALRVVADPPSDRPLRWLIVAALALLVIAAIAGVFR